VRQDWRDRLGVLVGRQPPKPATDERAPPAKPPHDWRERQVPVHIVEDQPVTATLYSRLRPEDVAAVEATVSGDEAVMWQQTPAEARAPLVLCLGVWARVPGVLERTGLIHADPPPEVHAMSRGPLAAGGDYYSADIVVEALHRAGGDITSVKRALDFGCSSGRTLRPLVAAYQGVDWHGVDPNADAIAWSSAHLPGIGFAVSPSDPPLDFPSGHFDLAYAISIWSHFGEHAARGWLDEMHRLVSPGGYLVLTVHGAQSVAYYGQTGTRPAEQIDDIGRSLHRSGFWYAAEFGEEGDFGIVHPEWGTAFMSAEWLLATATPAWHIASYVVGRNMYNQDVVVLRRAPC
jgi:SAM-dependent methyltransferase